MEWGTLNNFSWLQSNSSADIYFFTMHQNEIKHTYIYECHLYISVLQTTQVVHYLDICLTEFSNEEGYQRFPQKEKLRDKHTKERTLQQRAIFVWYGEPTLYTRKFYSKLCLHDMTLKTSVSWHIVQDNKNGILLPSQLSNNF